jgi:hypothetical protein
MIGQTISHCRIVEKLGDGGMGVVHEAEDVALHQYVAQTSGPEYFRVARQNEAARAADATA